MEACPKQECGFWGVPLEKVTSLADLTEDQFECCLWHEVQLKCSRDPRFANDPDTEDYFDPASDDELEDAWFEFEEE